MSQATHCFRPPLSASQSRPMKAIPAGGSVTRESQELSGRVLRRSSALPVCRVVFILFGLFHRVQGPLVNRFLLPLAQLSDQFRQLGCTGNRRTQGDRGTRNRSIRRQLCLRQLLCIQRGSVSPLASSKHLARCRYAVLLSFVLGPILFARADSLLRRRTRAGKPIVPIAHIVCVADHDG